MTYEHCSIPALNADGTLTGKELGIKGAPGDTFGDGLVQGSSFFNINGYNNLGTPCYWPNINSMDDVQIVDNLL